MLFAAAAARLEELLLENDRLSARPDAAESDALPAARPGAVRRGHWEQFRLASDDYATRMRCSVCGFVAHERGFGFCPGCGARVNGGTDNGE